MELQPGDWTVTPALPTATTLANDAQKRKVMAIRNALKMLEPLNWEIDDDVDLAKQVVAIWATIHDELTVIAYDTIAALEKELVDELDSDWYLSRIWVNGDEVNFNLRIIAVISTWEKY